MVQSKTLYNNYNSTILKRFCGRVNCFFFGTSWAMLRIEQNLPARSQKRGEAPIPRVGRGLPGFGIERAPSHEWVSALDHQATPAAQCIRHIWMTSMYDLIFVCIIWLLLPFWHQENQYDSLNNFPSSPIRRVDRWKRRASRSHKAKNSFRSRLKLWKADEDRSSERRCR